MYSLILLGQMPATTSLGDNFLPGNMCGVLKPSLELSVKPLVLYYKLQSIPKLVSDELFGAAGICVGD